MVFSSIQSLFVLSIAFSSASAAPAFGRQPDSLQRHERSSSTSNTPPLPTLTLPPPTDLNLKIITLGVGTQNYTCNSTVGTYSTNIALAQLYDATKYLSKHPDKVSTLSHERLAEEAEHGDCYEEEDYHPHLRRVGEHFYADKTPLLPDFDLAKLDLFIDAKAADKIHAPDADNDIDWVYLAASGSELTKGLKAVYRVETAGGKPPATCSGDEQVFIPYAALYWFYD